MKHSMNERVVAAFRGAPFIMLRYETQYTPCTGITAVTKQERRNFGSAIMISPWCPEMKEAIEASKSGLIEEAGSFVMGSRRCHVRISTDEAAPVVYLALDGHFLGRESPYDTPGLKRDALAFGLAVESLCRQMDTTPHQFLWAADWETVPAMLRLRGRHTTALTIHNTFDECLAEESKDFDEFFTILQTKRKSDGEFKTALELGMEAADVVTTVNPGFAHGLRTEPIQSEIMAKHLRHLVHRVVGISNANFGELNPSLKGLSDLFGRDFDAAQSKLLTLKEEGLQGLPEAIQKKASGKVIIVTMGRRVAQKLHEVFAESVRVILTKEPECPLLAFFATVHGDRSSPTRLRKLKKLEKEFPKNVVCTDGRLSYYSQLMNAADYNCMPSLYEPHGGAFEGTVVPIARAIDGLAQQICALDPTGPARQMNALWHPSHELPSGLLFREPPQYGKGELRELLATKVSPGNTAISGMVEALIPVLRTAVELRTKRFGEYARLVMGVLRRQQGQSWHVNLGGMLALVERARMLKRANDDRKPVERSTGARI